MKVARAGREGLEFCLGLLVEREKAKAEKELAGVGVDVDGDSFLPDVVFTRWNAGYVA